MNSSLQNYQKQSKINRCFFYKNIHQVPITTEKLTFFYALQKDFSLKSLVKLSALLELITGQKAYFIRSKKSSAFLKIRKGNPSGVKVTLRKKALMLFISKLVWEIFPNIKTLKKKYISKIKNKNMNSLMFKISDPLIFSELKNFYFYFKNCSDLRFLLFFSKKLKKNELYFNSRFFRFLIF